uniref:DUF1902 domain-containing protein n=2 Tax=unclassified Candidatus Kentrum TaxID=2643149 RepID=A0A451AX32_9GAMM|nr:MAG: hypothetical protein BECKLPF1236B_GA0070989_12602 [Candidatus Kentron sp. LPFa]VFK65968.1 MAG: hypothetical protein BECKUNK1418G_GA0071005_107416 [Candidatus Kentron sp. UNK]VFK70613.1 MAG: hypothetical protein BECKUNK1418H_GA0071006_103328 [Candidatus Kentron sp. UNK]
MFHNEIPHNKTFLHCYAEEKDGYWQAFCLDFTLAAQGDTFEESRAKLVSMVEEYIYDAVNGEDRKYRKQLLSRRASARFWVKYYVYKILHRVWQSKNTSLILPPQELGYSVSY